MQLRMTAAEVEAFLREEFPQVADQVVVEALTVEETVVRLRVGDAHLRPGGTVSGPSMFAAADMAVYVATLSRIGPVALAVTTNCTINFMRKPPAADLRARARLLKVGRTLVVGEAGIFSEGIAEPVAHAVLTYAIPPRGTVVK